jgi:ATP-dependent exoDNAse (exonuclease V) beta subunit
LVAFSESFAVSPGAKNSVSTTERIADVPPYEPPLLRPIPYRPDHAARTLPATAVAMLGQAHVGKAEESEKQPTLDRFARLRRHLLNAAPPSIPDITLEYTQAGPDGRPPNRIIGEIVHRALQFGLQVSALNTPDQLKIYAWQVGVTETAQVEYAVQEAMRLLTSNEESEIVQRLRKAVQSYRELPFSLRWGERTINGQIDALYLEHGGRWVVLDYKTDDVAAEFVYGHSQRYVGQVGVYAAAVEQLTGQAPRVFLHYIRPGVTVAVREADWRAALERLESELQIALAEPQ